MEIMASVKFKGGITHYIIKSGNSGLYHARLVRHEGDLSEQPPNEITIIRGIRQWTGSYNEDFLIEKLGEMIEDAIARRSANKDTDSKSSCCAS